MPPASSTGGRSSSLLLPLPSRRLQLLLLVVVSDGVWMGVVVMVLLLLLLLLLLTLLGLGRRDFDLCPPRPTVSPGPTQQPNRPQHNTTDKPVACHQFRALCSLPPSSTRMAQREATLEGFLALLSLSSSSSSSSSSEDDGVMHSLVGTDGYTCGDATD